MKNVSLVLNAVLLIAVAVLYYLHFSSKPAAGTKDAVSLSGLKVGYVNADSLTANYEYIQAGAAKLESKGKKLDQDLKNRAQALQNEFESYQRTASSLTIGQARAVEEDLTKKRQNLQLYQESLNQEMLVEQGKIREELYKKVAAFMKKYGAENGLQLVFKYDATSDLMFGQEGLDISKDVIKGLNEAYRLEQAAAPKKDSTAKK